MHARRETVIAIDLLRVAAAAMVVAYHLGAAIPRYPAAPIIAMATPVPVPIALTHATWWGWVGVEIFFVISGLVIAASAQGTAPGAFLRRRALRLLPAAWVCATATLLAMRLAAPGEPVLGAWAASLLLLPTAAPIDPSYWTLSIELGFYCVVAAVLTGGGDARRLERAAMLLGGASIAFWCLVALTGGGTLADDFTFQLTLLPHGCLFAAGVLIAARHRGPTSWRDAALMIALLATGAAEIWHRAGTIAYVLRLDVWRITPVVVFAAAMLAVLATRRAQPWLDRWVGQRRAARAGATTYPLYLVHQVAGAAVTVWLFRAGLPPLAALAGAIGVVTVFACWTAWVAEPAIRSRIRRFRGLGRGIPASASLPAG